MTDHTTHRPTPRVPDNADKMDSRRAAADGRITAETEKAAPSGGDYVKSGDLDFAALWRSLGRAGRGALAKAVRGEAYRHGNGYMGDRVRQAVVSRGLATFRRNGSILWDATQLGHALARWAAEHGEAVSP